jgi:hypothetical protein
MQGMWKEVKWKQNFSRTTSLTRILQELTDRWQVNFKMNFKNIYLWHILKPSAKRKAKKNLTVSIKTSNGTEEEATLNGTTGIAPLRGFVR